jgi:predicted RNase H-like HicB family nuclease
MSAIKFKRINDNMKPELSIQIWKKGSWFIARCPELDFVSQGRTKDEAKYNLMEVVEI